MEREDEVDERRVRAVSIAWPRSGVDARGAVEVKSDISFFNVAPLRSSGVVSSSSRLHVVGVHRCDLSVVQSFGELGVTGSDAAHFHCPLGLALAVHDTALVVAEAL